MKLNKWIGLGVISSGSFSPLKVKAEDVGEGTIAGKTTEYDNNSIRSGTNGSDIPTIAWLLPAYLQGALSRVARLKVEDKAWTR